MNLDLSVDLRTYVPTVPVRTSTVPVLTAPVGSFQFPVGEFQNYSLIAVLESILVDATMPKTVLESLSNFIDDHLRLFRLLPWFVGTCGVLLLYKHSRSALQRFPRARDIPHSCVEAHLPLYGVVVYVCENGMDVWHVPLWRHLLRMGHRPSG